MRTPPSVAILATASLVALGSLWVGCRPGSPDGACDDPLGGLPQHRLGTFHRESAGTDDGHRIFHFYTQTSGPDGAVSFTSWARVTGPAGDWTSQELFSWAYWTPRPQFVHAGGVWHVAADQMPAPSDAAPRPIYQAQKSDGSFGPPQIIHNLGGNIAGGGFAVSPSGRVAVLTTLSAGWRLAFSERAPGAAGFVTETVATADGEVRRRLLGTSTRPTS